MRVLSGSIREGSLARAPEVGGVGGEGAVFEGGVRTHLQVRGARAIRGYVALERARAEPRHGVVAEVRPPAVARVPARHA
eukprot:1184503-Prorocentrum_minimum.AAC.1